MGDFNSSQLLFKITLERLSMTKFISHVYEHHEIKEKMKEIIRTKSTGQKASFPMKSIKKEIIKLASQKIRILELPKNLIGEMQGLLIFFAEKTASWAEFVTTSLELDMSYLDQIYWFHEGTINVAKIFHEYWKTHRSFPSISASNADNESFTSIMACKYAIEEIIFAHQDEIMKKVQKFLKNIPMPDVKNKADQIIAIYTCYLYGVGYDMTHKADLHKKFQQTGNVNIQDTIFMCDGNANAIKYLWNFLNKEEKDWIILQLAFDNLRKGLWTGAFDFKGSGTGVIEFEMFNVTGYAAVVHFLINEMTVEQRSLFFMHMAPKVIELFLRVWPYPELCLIMLNDQTICEFIIYDCPNVILPKLLNRMVHDFSNLVYVSGTCHYPSVFYELLTKILSLVPKDAKEMIFFEPSSCIKQGIIFPQAIENFYHIFDVNALGIVINDKDLKRKRDLMISMGSKKISWLLNRGNLKAVIKFIEKVLISYEERKKFIKSWKLDDHVLVADNLEIQEKIFGWL